MGKSDHPLPRGVRLAVAILRVFSVVWIVCTAGALLMMLGAAVLSVCTSDRPALVVDSGVVGSGLMVAMGAAMWVFARSIEENHREMLGESLPRWGILKVLWFCRSLVPWAIRLFEVLLAVHGFRVAAGLFIADGELVRIEEDWPVWPDLVASCVFLALIGAASACHRLIGRKLARI